MADDEKDVQTSDPTPEAPAAEPAPEPVDMNLIGLESGPDVVYIPNPGDDRARRIRHGGQNYEHVSDDVHGRWIYRAMAFLLCLLGLSGVVQAQTVPIDSYELRYYAVGATQPVQVDSFLSAGVSCDLAAPSSFSTVNPTRIWFDDPNRAGRSCRYDLTTGARLFSLPVGNYQGSLVAINEAGASGESARAPFSRLDTHPVLRGLQFGR